MDDFDIEKAIAEDLQADYDVVKTINNADLTSDFESQATPTEIKNVFANFKADANENNSDPDPQTQGQATEPKANVLHNGENWTDIPVLGD